MSLSGRICPNRAKEHKMAKMWLNVDILVEVDNLHDLDEAEIPDIADILQNVDKSDILDFHVQPDNLDNEDGSVSSVIREMRDRRLNPDKYYN